MPDVQQIAEAVFREQSGKIISGLIRLSGSFDLAEETRRSFSPLLLFNAERLLFNCVRYRCVSLSSE